MSGPLSEEVEDLGDGMFALLRPGAEPLTEDERATLVEYLCFQRERKAIIAAYEGEERAAKLAGLREAYEAAHDSGTVRSAAEEAAARLTDRCELFAQMNARFGRSGTDDGRQFYTDIRAVLTERRRLQERVAELEADRARYGNEEMAWAVRLSRGTFLEFHHDEQTARERAAMYHATLLVCDVRSADWREAEPAPAAPAGAGESGV